MGNISLLVIAAGIGSRFGGLKQIASIGGNGESIIDYSVYDAIASGFNKVVFVIRREFQKEFEDNITNKYAGKIQVEFVFQELNALPNGLSCPKERKLPWGTGHAILSASNLIKEPFCVINADDFYGRESFKKIKDFFSKDSSNLSMVYFKLGKTLSHFGGVNRAICELKNGFLRNLIEKENIQNNNGVLTSNNKSLLDSRAPVSLNMWGFRPFIFDHLEEMFIKFINKNEENLNSEFGIPTVINYLIRTQSEKIFALNSNSNWLGITYKEDIPFVESEIQKIVDNGEYPKVLF
ncbi:MAG: sugar phosphate nucleotidyltransferase [SAR324 cluster bacterium]|nr:sugar phosphate nucleotidyltransferase [SAR324 cluster bacterium]